MPQASRRQNSGSMSLTSRANQGHELGARRQVAAESATHGTRRAQAARLAYAADRHAGVGRFEYDADTAWFEFFHDKVGELFRHAFLHLRPPAQRFDGAGELAQTD